ncbi:YfjI family protein [Parachlamydia sp.]|uniref:YfjI family protein n=1 Tax=Parachlamydia sp. TaxID=2052048 RepID=UPI003D12A512
MDEADRMPCPPDFIAVSAIVALGTIVGARCVIKPKSLDDWIIVPNLWGGVVGLPSAKKSPAISAALKPLDRLVSQANEIFQKETEAFEIEKTIFEAKKDALGSHIKSEMKSEIRKPKLQSKLDELAEKLSSQRQEAPIEPKLRRYKSNDTTVEKLGELLKDNPAGMLVLRDELVGLIASWDRDGREGERTFYLEGWNGYGSFDTDRIKRGTIFIPNLCISIFGGIQPDKLIVYLEQASKALSNDGLLQRFQMLVYPDYRAWEWRDRAPNKKVREDVFSLFEVISNFDPVAFGATPSDIFTNFPFFNFDDAAQKIFIEWSEDLHLKKMPQEDNPLIQQHLAKYDKLFPALALLFHLVDCVQIGQQNWGPVKAASATKAAAWCEYLESHARRCYGLLADEGLRAAQSLTSKIAEGKLSSNFTARDVRRNQWRNLTTDDAVKAAIDWLEDEGWLQSYKVGGTGPGSGQPTTRYTINPKVLALNENEKTA